MVFSRIIGTGSYLPEKVLSNDDLAQMVDTSDAWVTERTGIKRRHILGENESTASMGTVAAQRAVEAAGIQANDVELILVGTCTPDYMFPSTACVIQHRLGIKANIPAFDVSAACAGFIYALSVADQYIKSGAVKTALVVGSEALSRAVDWQDRSTCVLFGDGAGAVVLSASAEPGIYSTHIHAQGAYEHLLTYPNAKAMSAEASDHQEFIGMRGNEVFKLAVRELGNVAEASLQANGFSSADIDWLIPHQANLRIISAMAKRMNLPMEKIVLTVAEHGNTSSASIPLALDEAVRDGRVKKGDKLLFDAIGGGMAWGSALLTY